MLSERKNPAHIIHPAFLAHQSGLAHSSFRRVDPAKLRAKRLNCKTCDGKGCVGRCHFEKVN